jgi:hypothetical protein
MRTSCFAVAVVGMTLALGASAAVAPQDKIPLLPRSGWTDPLAVTVVGCIVQGTSAGGYALTTSVPQPEATDKDAIKSIKLVLTGTEVDLSQHVGHTVSVTGVPAIHWATGTAGTTSSETPVSEGAVTYDDKKTTRTFAVKSLKMIAAFCGDHN